MQTFKIHKEIEKHPEIRDGFVVTVEFDDDQNTRSFKAGPFKNTPLETQYMGKFIDVLERMQVISYDEFDAHGYQKIEEFNNWFVQDFTEGNAPADLWYINFTFRSMLPRWSYDSIYQHDCYIYGYVVNYYDENGYRHEVTVEEI